MHKIEYAAYSKIIFQEDEGNEFDKYCRRDVKSNTFLCLFVFAGDIEAMIV